jgi:hypothetical protein
MRLTALFQVPRVDFARYRQALHERLSEALVQATMSYIDATAERIVPVWSGASRATFSELASHVGYVLMLSPVGGAPNRVSLGLANGTGTFETDSANGIYRFSYSTTLSHLIINEYHDATQWGFHLINPGPYHFQEAGAEAFRQVASEVELPGWSSILTVMPLSGG